MYKRIVAHDLFDMPILISVRDNAKGLNEPALICEFERLFAPANVVSVKPWNTADRCLIYDQVIKLESHDHN